MRAGYAQARRDLEYLETISQLDDWVELMSDLETFMRNPNKQYARSLYERAIGLWFGEHGVEGHGRRVDGIADRWGHI